VGWNVTTSNAGFIWPSYSDPLTDAELAYTPTFSGGDWSLTLTLANLQDPDMSLRARSINATAAKSLFIVDLKRAVSIAAMAIPKHNLTKDATFRIRGSANADGMTAAVYDSTVINVFDPAVTKQDLANKNIALRHVLSAPASARYWRIELIDTSNPDGVIDIFRLCMGALYQPSINPSYGSRDGLETESVATIGDGGARIVDDRAIRRIFSGTIPNLPDTEVYASLRQMQRLLGISGQFFWMFDATDTSALRYERDYLACFKALSAVDYAFHTRSNFPIELTEDL
jgi:hypothetical protein